MRAFAVGSHCEMTQNAAARYGASIALVCRVFGVSETCFRYGPNLRAENEAIADLLTGLTDGRKTWGGRNVLSASTQRKRPFVELLPGNEC